MNVKEATGTNLISLMIRLNSKRQEIFALESSAKSASLL